MSYDLMFWRESGAHDPGETWEALARSETPSWLAPLSVDEVRRAFDARFGTRVAFEPTDRGVRVLGPGFEVVVEDGAHHLHVTCAWGLLETREGARVLAELRHTGCVLLGCTCFNPQVETSRLAPRAPRPAVDTPAAPPSLGPLLDALMKRGVLHGELADGFFTAAVLRSRTDPAEPLARAARQLLTHPSAARLERLELDVAASFSEITEQVVQEIAAAPRASSLREVRMSAGLDLGDVPAMLESAAQLERFSASPKSAVWRPFEHAHLAWLSLTGEDLTGEDLDALAASKLPALKGLSLSLAPKGETRELEPKTLRGLFVAAPQLISLQLRGVANAAVIAGELGTLDAAARLESLDLDPVDDPAVLAFVAAKDRLPQLEWLGVDLAPCSAEVVDAVYATFGRRASGYRAPRVAAPLEPAAPKVVPPVRPPPKPASLELDEGDRVRHSRFGVGVVESVDDARVTVRFADGTARTLPTKFLERDGG